MLTAEVYGALDAKLLVFSQQRAGKDGIPLMNALTEKNYTVEELFREIDVLQQALRVGAINLSTPAESLSYVQNPAFEKEDMVGPMENLPPSEKVALEKQVQDLLNQLKVLSGRMDLSSAESDSDHSTTGRGGSQLREGQSQKSLARANTQWVNVRAIRAGAQSALNPRTALLYTMDELVQEMRDLQQKLKEVDSISPFLPFNDQGKLRRNFLIIATLNCE